MTRILVAVDGSDPADNALSFALEKHPDAELVAVTVVDPSSFIHGSTDLVTPDVKSWQAQAEKEAEALLAAATDRAETGGVTIETDVVYGTPSRAIVQYAEDEDVDLVIVGSHGRDGVARVLLGSVAETVVRRSPVPVTVVR